MSDLKDLQAVLALVDKARDSSARDKAVQATLDELASVFADVQGALERIQTPDNKALAEAMTKGMDAMCTTLAASLKAITLNVQAPPAPEPWKRLKVTMDSPQGKREFMIEKVK